MMILQANFARLFQLGNGRLVIRFLKPTEYCCGFRRPETGFASLSFLSRALASFVSRDTFSIVPALKLSHFPSFSVSRRGVLWRLLNASVSCLCLTSNRIGATGVALLARALRVNASVTHLDLGGNDIGALGAASLAAAMRVNASVTHPAAPTSISTTRRSVRQARPRWHVR